MNQLSYPILSTVIFLPMFGALLILMTRRVMGITEQVDCTGNKHSDILLVSPVVHCISIKQHTRCSLLRNTAGYPTGISITSLGVDGISVLFVLLSTLCAILCVLISWEAITKKVKEFYIAILLTTSFMIGVFCSLDFFLFYLFWEAMLIPMFLIIGVWGGPNRIYAAIKFFLYTLVGSVADARRHHRALLLFRQDLRYPRNDDEDISLHDAVMALLGVLCGICRQGSHVAGSYMVAGRTY